MFGPESSEEVKEVVEDAMPSVVIMEDDYFQTDAHTKFKSQLETLKERMERVAKVLPMNQLIVT